MRRSGELTSGLCLHMLLLRRTYYPCTYDQFPEQIAVESFQKHWSKKKNNKVILVGSRTVQPAAGSVLQDTEQIRSLPPPPLQQCVLHLQAYLWPHDWASRKMIIGSLSWQKKGANVFLPSRLTIQQEFSSFIWSPLRSLITYNLIKF